MQYHRARIKGGTYFFTVVTHNRRRFLCQPENVELLRAALREVKATHPFKIEAIVVLPDHLHCLWALPENDDDYSTRWRLVKSYFSRESKGTYGGQISLSRQRKQEQSVWQRRFWEHLIRDESDFRRHVDYIHYNPVKHGLVKAPKDWKYSSFHRYVQAGIYGQDWGAHPIEFGPNVGHE